MNDKEKSSDQQDEMSDNSKDKTMEVDEYPKIKGFKHKYLELQQTSIINLQDSKEEESPYKKNQEDVSEGQI